MMKKGAELELLLTIEEVEKEYRKEYTSSKEEYITADLSDDRTQLVEVFDDGFYEFWEKAKTFFEKGKFIVEKTYNHELAVELDGFDYGLEMSWFKLIDGKTRIIIMQEDEKWIVKQDDFIMPDYMGDPIEDLNMWLNSGWKIESIEDKVYTLIEDDIENYFVQYTDKENDIYYAKLMTHSTASLFEQFRGCSFDEVQNGDDEKTITIDLSGEKLIIESLVNANEEYINVKKLLEREDIDVLELIEEDLSNAY